VATASIWKNGCYIPVETSLAIGRGVHGDEVVLIVNGVEQQCAAEEWLE
jgi:hypothetical protein